MCKRVGVPVPVMSWHCAHTDVVGESLLKTEKNISAISIHIFQFRQSKRPNLCLQIKNSNKQQENENEDKTERSQTQVKMIPNFFYSGRLQYECSIFQLCKMMLKALFPNPEVKWRYYR